MLDIGAMTQQRIKELENQLAKAQDLIDSLQQQNATLRSTPQAANQHAAARQGNSEAVSESNEQPSRLMALPAELRDAIYDLCVAKEKVMVRWKDVLGKDLRFQQYDSYNPPRFERLESQLLAVSKQVCVETLKRLLSTNTFYIMPSEIWVPNFQMIYELATGNPSQD